MKGNKKHLFMVYDHEMNVLGHFYGQKAQFAAKKVANRYAKDGEIVVYLRETNKKTYFKYKLWVESIQNTVRKTPWFGEIIHIGKTEYLGSMKEIEKGKFKKSKMLRENDK